MATYEELHGKRVEVFTTDPTLDSSYEGQVWFNSTDGVNKTVVAVEAWASSSNMTSGRGAMGHGSASQTAGLVFGGFLGPGTYYAKTEEYNGIGWSNSSDLPAARGWIQGAGTQTAAIGMGGFDSTGSSVQTSVYNYNGTSWTSNPHSLPAAIADAGSAGTQTSCIIYSGRSSPGSAVTNSYEYDGSSWTAGGTMGTGRRLAGGGGTQSSCRSTGGVTSPSTTYINNSEEYNGTSWSEGPDINTARRDLAGSGATADAQRVTGGTNNNPGPGTAFRTISEAYDGTSWSEGPDLATGRQDSSPSMNASSNSTFMAGGYTAADTAPGGTEEFTRSASTTTPAAWSSGGNLNLGRHNGGNAGTQTAGLFFGGKVYPNVFKNESEEYDGTSWTEGNNLGTARMIAGAGTQTAGLGFGGTNGAPGSTGVQALTEEYDGTSWSENGDMSTARMDLGGAGIQTAAYAAGGIGSPNAVNNLHEQYNGSSWSTSTAMNIDRSTMGSVGTTTAGLVFGGYIPPSYAFATSSEEWNGSAWTSGGTLITARVGLGGFGSQTDAIGFAGATPPNNNSAVTEGYDGTAFSTRPSMAQARMQFSPSGSYNSGSDGMAVGGSNAGNPMYTNTEEWNAETSTVTAKTLTTS